MPFTSYATYTDVARVHRIQVRREAFLQPSPQPLSEYFRAELTLTLTEVAFDGSEYAACEALIYPFLREVWKSYRDTLTLWSHQALAFNEDLSGTPDYIVARRSALGPLVFDAPYLLVVEAKKDDFVRGWGQCLAAMLAAQKLNGAPGQAQYGISTNGRIWEFGRLQGDAFTLDPQLQIAQDSEALAATLNFVFAQCRDEAARYTNAA